MCQKSLSFIAIKYKQKRNLIILWEYVFMVPGHWKQQHFLTWPSPNVSRDLTLLRHLIIQSHQIVDTPRITWIPHHVYPIFSKEFTGYGLSKHSGVIKRSLTCFFSKCSSVTSTVDNWVWKLHHVIITFGRHCLLRTAVSKHLWSLIHIIKINLSTYPNSSIFIQKAYICPCINTLCILSHTHILFFLTVHSSFTYDYKYLNNPYFHSQVNA